MPGLSSTAPQNSQGSLRNLLKNNYDRAILVAGDGDFADIVRMVKDEGKTVEVAMFQSSRAWALVQAADLIVDLNNDFLDGCWRVEYNSSSPDVRTENPELRATAGVNVFSPASRTEEQRPLLYRRDRRLDR